MLFPRRFLSFVLFLLALGTVAHAQQQEQKLMERLKRGPNSNLTYDTSQSAFGSRSVATKSAPKTKDFGTRDFASHEFLSKPYGGTEKRSWFANLFFSAKAANTSSKYEIPNAGQQYGTKNAPTKEARDAGKVAGTTTFAATDLQYLKRNRFDTSLKAAPPQDKAVGYTGDLRPMSIDDVRELLNKNK